MTSCILPTSNPSICTFHSIPQPISSHYGIKRQEVWERLSEENRRQEEEATTGIKLRLLLYQNWTLFSHKRRTKKRLFSEDDTVPLHFSRHRGRSQRAALSWDAPHELTELAANASDWCAWMWCTDASANHLPSFEAQSQSCEINPKVLSLFPFEPVIKHFFNHDSSLQLFLCW